MIPCIIDIPYEVLVPARAESGRRTRRSCKHLQCERQIWHQISGRSRRYHIESVRALVAWQITCRVLGFLWKDQLADGLLEETQHHGLRRKTALFISGPRSCPRSAATP